MKIGKYYKKQLKKVVEFIIKHNKQLEDKSFKEIENNIINMIHNLHNDENTWYFSSMGVTIVKIQEDDNSNFYDILVDPTVGKNCETIILL